MLRYPPNTVEVVSLVRRRLDDTQEARSRERWVSMGQLNVRQVDYDEGINIDRRKARYHTELIHEGPFDVQRIDPEHERFDAFRTELDRHPLREILHCDNPDLMALERDRCSLLASTVRPTIPGQTVAGGLRLVGGTWIADVRETLRDVVCAGERLVEDAPFVQVLPVPARVRTELRRQIRTVATSLALEVTGKGRRALLDDRLDLDHALLEDRAAHHGLARAMAMGLRRKFIGLDDEYRVQVIGRPSGDGAWERYSQPEPGSPGPYARYDETTARSHAHEVLETFGQGPAHRQAGISDLCALFDWMHQAVRYEKDEVQYREKEYIATVAETLNSRKGDCEDHAILFASLCVAIGFSARTVLLSDHALTEIYLGSDEDGVDPAAIGDAIRDWQQNRSRNLGCQDMNRPYRKGEWAEGWKQDEGRWIRESTAGECSIEWTGIGIDRDEHGGLWLICDDCMGGDYPGDVSGLKKEKYRDDESWKGEVSYQYPQQQVTDWRILIYRLRDGELHPSDHMIPVLEHDLGEDILPAAFTLLEGCDCEDGCSACCGGLGTIDTLAFGASPPDRFIDADVVSRRGAYRLLCAVMGLQPDWERFGSGDEEGPGSGAVPPGGELIPPSDSALQRLVGEALGTRGGNLENGAWAQMFGDKMVLNEEWLAKARWSTRDEDDQPWLGLYRAGANEVVIRTGRSKDATLETITHEFCHNWQFRSGAFDLDRHIFGAEALQYFYSGGPGTPYRESSKLVIEGHASWADHTYRFRRGLGSHYSSTNPGQWNEYKVGFFLIQGIVNAFGIHGLFRWLGPAPDEGPPLRSRDKRLKWPFTLTEAVRAFGLEREARTGVYDGIDVEIGEHDLFTQDGAPSEAAPYTGTGDGTGESETGQESGLDLGADRDTEPGT
jgi:hypothetical protein